MSNVTIEQWAEMCFSLLANADDDKVVAEFSISDNPEYEGKAMRVTVELVEVGDE